MWPFAPSYFPVTPVTAKIESPVSWNAPSTRAPRAQHGLAAAEYAPGFTSMIRCDPVGVVGSIAPWNYPLMMAA
jgi:acyl-CoA reductase-like NAD-dependent aldehyde dehydrogenase